MHPTKGTGKVRSLCPLRRCSVAGWSCFASGEWDMPWSAGSAVVVGWRLWGRWEKIDFRQGAPPPPDTPARGTLSPRPLRCLRLVTALRGRGCRFGARPCGRGCWRCSRSRGGVVTGSGCRRSLGDRCTFDEAQSDAADFSCGAGPGGCPRVGLGACRRFDLLPHHCRSYTRSIHAHRATTQSVNHDPETS